MNNNPTQEDQNKDMEKQESTLETQEEVTQNKTTEAENLENQEAKETVELSETEKLQMEIETLKAQKTELQDKWLRLNAEFQNFRKRTAKERIDLLQTAGRDVIEVLLPVLDDFDRAKKAAESDDNIEPFSEGVMLVYNKLNKVLEQKGLKPLDSTGTKFDPDFHDAITEIPAPTEEMKGTVIDTVEKGYFLNDKIIRYAKVVVGK